MDVRGKTVLLTGATGGLGLAIARRLGGAGAQLILSGRRVEVLEPLTSELGARVIGADLADRDEVERLIAESGDVDILVANAALPGSGRVTSLSVGDIDRALDVNLRAPIMMARALAPPMAGRGGGHIVFISSLSGKAATAGTAIYNATKFGMRGFLLALRADLRDQNIGVSGIYPGFIRDAGMFADTGIKLPPGVGTRKPEHVADAVLAAIERNKAEIDVAAFGVRASSLFAAIAPELAARAGRLIGAEKVALQFESTQSDKR